MLPVRRALAARPRLSLVYSQRRQLSASHDGHAHDEHFVDTEDYGKEPGFMTAGWLKTFIAAWGIYGFYLFAPDPTESNSIATWLVGITPSSDVWIERNLDHTASAAEGARDENLTNSTTVPPVRRITYPQIFEAASPFSVPVGLISDVSSVRARGRDTFLIKVPKKTEQ